MLKGSGLDFQDPPADAVRLDQAFSLVIDESETKTRRLPSFYFMGAQLYAARALDDVVLRLADTATRFVASDERPLYLLHACELDGRAGLYGRDFFNRSRFRLKLARLGMTFTDDPFVHLEYEGKFSCSDRGSFEPKFLIHDALPPDGPSIFRLGGASILWWLNTRRLGKLTRRELRTLSRVSLGLDVVNAPEPDELMAELRKVM